MSITGRPIDSDHNDRGMIRQPEAIGGESDDALSSALKGDPYAINDYTGIEGALASLRKSSTIVAGSPPVNQLAIDRILEPPTVLPRNNTTDYDWQPYPVTWTAVTVNPTLGNGTLAAQFKIIDRLCLVNLQLVVGTTTAAGTGAWIFSLPSAMSMPIKQVGSGYIFDSSAGLHYALIPYVTPSAAERLVGGVHGAGQVGAGGFPGGATWANGDELNIFFPYRL